jgi:hypothetical protein
MRGARYAEASSEQRFGPLEARLAELEIEIGAFAIAAAAAEARLAALEQTRRRPNPRR